jgi:hypothetical protein
MPFQGYSLERPMSERHFLQRELDIEWIVRDPISLGNYVKNSSQNGKPTLLLVSNPDLYLELACIAPEKSLVLFLLGDEAYSPSFLRLARKMSVRAVFRNYSLQHLGFWSASCEIVTWGTRLIKSPKSGIAFLKLVILGLRSQFRMRSWQDVSAPVLICPLGYTEKFALSYCELRSGVMGNDSLFDLEVLDSGDRLFEYSFRGSQGQLQRMQMVTEIQALDEKCDVEMVEGEWNGALTSRLSGLDYVQSLLNSKRALCPPGYTNNESFRYYESLICGSLPVEANVAVSHLGFLVARPRPNSHASIEDRLSLVRKCLKDVKFHLEAQLN